MASLGHSTTQKAFPTSETSATAQQSRAKISAEHIQLALQLYL